MTTSTAVDQQNAAQLVTEEWMMMHPPSSSSPSSSSLLIPPTFLEIMFLKETEQYIYTKFLPTLLTEIHTKYIRPFVHQLLVSLLLKQQEQQQQSPPAAVAVASNFVENDKSNNESAIHQIHHSIVIFWKRIRNFFHRIQMMVRRRYIQTYLLPMMIRIVTHMDTYTNTTTNNNHYRLEIIYLLRYILDRYTLIKYHCTFIELLYGGGNMIRKKTVRSVPPPPPPIHNAQHHPNNDSTTTTTTQSTKILLPLQKNDQIRTALLVNLMEYIYEKSNHILLNNNRIKDDHNNQHSKSQPRISRMLSPCIGIVVSNLYYIFHHIYYPYQYLIGTSYYINLHFRLLQQILLLQRRPQQLPLPSTPTTNHITNESSTLVNVNTVPSSSSSSLPSFSWYMTTILRTSGIVILSGCYVTQMIQYYIQRRRTIRQEQLLLQVQRQQPLSSPQRKRRNHHISITTCKHPNTNSNNNDDDDDDDTSTMDDETLSFQRFLLSSSSEMVDILPVPLLPNDIQKSRLLRHTIYHQKGHCPICQQPIHPSDSTLKTTTTTTTSTITMLYGYVYCSYTCIYHYLLHHNHICPMTGRLVQHLPTTTNTTGSTENNTTTSSSDHPPQLIRLL